MGITININGPATIHVAEGDPETEIASIITINTTDPDPDRLFAAFSSKLDGAARRSQPYEEMTTEGPDGTSVHHMVTKPAPARTLDVELLDGSVSVRCPQSLTTGAAIYAEMNDDLKKLVADGVEQVTVDNIERLLERHRDAIVGQKIAEVSIWAMGPIVAHELAAGQKILLGVWSPSE